MKKILVMICVMFLACLCFAEENVRTQAERLRSMKFKVYLLTEEARDLQGLLAKAGVTPAAGASAHYAAQANRLMVMNTEANLEKIAAFVKSRGGVPFGVVPPQNTIEEKMGKIVIPEIEFHKANIQEVVEFLNKSAKENDKETSDPAMKGVKITLNVPDAAEQAYPPITFTARSISLNNTVQIICRTAGIEYDIDTNRCAVVLLEKDAQVRREFPASNKAIALLNGMAGGDLRRALGELGADLPAKAKVSYDAKTGKLIVESTPSSQQTLARVISNLLMELAPTALEVQMDIAVCKLTPMTAKKIQSLMPMDANPAGPRQPSEYTWTTNMDKAAQCLREVTISQRLYMKHLTGTPGVEARDTQNTGGRTVSVEWTAEVSGAIDGPRFVNLNVAVQINGPRHQKNGDTTGLHFVVKLLPTGKSGVVVSPDGQYAVYLTVAKCEPVKDTGAAPKRGRH